MDTFVIARHGNHDGGMINESGKHDITALAHTLQSIVAGKSGIILSSTAQRAEQSAYILSDILGFDVQSHAILWCAKDNKNDESSAPNKHKAFDLVNDFSKSFDVVIVVTHLAYAEDLPPFFTFKKFGKPMQQVSWLKEGEAYIIDCNLDKPNCRHITTTETE